tara:strand:- start:2506 stop:2697 length:192 start_codon:yes stop_codon:yes gene_type:complete
MGRTEKQEGHFKATTVELKWNGKTYRVASDVAEAIKKRPDYSEEASKKAPKKAPKKPSQDISK